MKRYIKPEVEILRAEAYAVILANSLEGHQVDEGTVAEGDEVFMSKDDDSANDWPSYSAWDE